MLITSNNLQELPNPGMEDQEVEISPYRCRCCCYHHHARHASSSSPSSRGLHHAPRHGESPSRCPRTRLHACCAPPPMLLVLPFLVLLVLFLLVVSPSHVESLLILVDDPRHILLFLLSTQIPNDLQKASVISIFIGKRVLIMDRRLASFRGLTVR